LKTKKPQSFPPHEFEKLAPPEPKAHTGSIDHKPATGAEVKMLAKIVVKRGAKADRVGEGLRKPRLARARSVRIREVPAAPWQEIASEIKRN
jgi:hypothetical protein